MKSTRRREHARAIWRAIQVVLICLALSCGGQTSFARQHHRTLKQKNSRVYREVREQLGHPTETTVPLDDATATVAFSPKGEGEALVVHAIRDARKEILVQAYGFTNKTILKALADARRRGIQVKVLLDKSNETARYSGATYVSNAGIPLWIDDTVAIAHNKVMIIDERNVITGSFNFTASAQRRNAENVLYLQNVPRLAAVYVADWNWRRGLSHPYERK